MLNYLPQDHDMLLASSRNDNESKDSFFSLS
jgi:hypothetical protein